MTTLDSIRNIVSTNAPSLAIAQGHKSQGRKGSSAARRDQKSASIKDAIDQGLLRRANTNVLLERRIEFREVHTSDAAQEALRKKYVAINSDVAPPSPVSPKPDGPAKSTTPEDHAEVLPAPAQVLFDVTQVKNVWRRRWASARGFANDGTTCYVNTALQALIHTPMLAEYFMANSLSDHDCATDKQNRCLLCHLALTTKEVLASHKDKGPVDSWFRKHLDAVATWLQVGMQEDTHEYLRCLLDKLQDICLQETPGLDEWSKNTTLVHQVFGGYTRSQVQCQKCHATSTTFQSALDLSLVLRRDKKKQTLETALKDCTAPEKLENYRCEKCGTTGDATKRMTIHTAPKNLTIHLGRFDQVAAGRKGFRKNHTGVQFPEFLNVEPHLSTPKETVYELYAVTMHNGKSPNYGHYTSMVRNSKGTWNYINDELVRPCTLRTVLGQQQEAYLLFYRLVEERPASAPQQVNHAGTDTKPSAGDKGVAIPRQKVKAAIEELKESSSPVSPIPPQERGRSQGKKKRQRSASPATVPLPVIPGSNKNKRVVQGEPKRESEKAKKHKSSHPPAVQPSPAQAPAGSSQPVPIASPRPSQPAPSTTAPSQPMTTPPITTSTTSPNKRRAPEQDNDHDRDASPSHPPPATKRAKAAHTTNANHVPVTPREPRPVDPSAAAPHAHAHAAWTPSLDPQYNSQVNQWEGLETHVQKMQRDRIVSFSKPKIRRATDAELEYDAGRKKKVRNKEAHPGAPRARHGRNR